MQQGFFTPDQINPHTERRGCPTWHEYARLFRIVPVSRRKVGIGTMYTAHLPTGQDVETPDLRQIEQEAERHECRRAFQFVGCL